MAPRKNDRMFFAVLAGATALLSGLAVTAILFGPTLAPSHFSSAFSPSDTLKLSYVDTTKSFPAETAVRTPTDQPRKIKVVLTATANPEKKLAAQTAVDLAAATAAAQAREAAKLALVEKLARQKLTRSLLAAQAAAKAAERTAEASISVAALQSAGTRAEAEADVVADQETTVVASLETGNAIKPGAIMPPTPGLKPELPKRRKPAVANRPVSNDGKDAASPVLAYANPGTPEDDENGIFGGIGKLFNGSKGGLPGRGSGIAVYDISAATVHMPDGTKLEAHSGIGHRMDNPKHVHVKNLGPTPPNVYKLRMRERRFHGVEAIRMLPYDRASMKGRDGMLTHTRLLRSSIGSHGCVAFKNYNKFLHAFKAGKIKTLIVVPSLNKLPTYMAKLERSRGA